MEVSGGLRGLAALPLGKEPTGEGAGWAPEPEKRKFVFFCRKSNTGRPSLPPVAIRTELLHVAYCNIFHRNVYDIKQKKKQISMRYCTAVFLTVVCRYRS
jgi:hypothetical protein